jgi:nickel superoxide dismutase
MLYNLVQALDQKLGFEEAKAHCDVPCGIYDPIVAQINALTVVRMMDLMAALEEGAEVGKKAYNNSMSRYIAVKEEHAEKAKHEIRVIYGDFINDAHIEAHPELPALFHKIMKLNSKAQFAEVFWAVKGVPTKKAKAPYAPALEMVYPDL